MSGPSQFYNISCTWLCFILLDWSVQAQVQLINVLQPYIGSFKCVRLLRCLKMNCCGGVGFGFDH